MKIQKGRVPGTRNRSGAVSWMRCRKPGLQIAAVSFPGDSAPETFRIWSMAAPSLYVGTNRGYHRLRWIRPQVRNALNLEVRAPCR